MGWLWVIFNEIYRYTVETAVETITDPNIVTVVDFGSQTITVTDPALNAVSTFWKVEARVGP